MCRSRRELSNEYLLAKIGVLACLLACVDTAENEPLEVWGKYSILFTGVLRLAACRPGAGPPGPRLRAAAAGPRRAGAGAALLGGRGAHRPDASRVRCKARQLYGYASLNILFMSVYIF